MCGGIRDYHNKKQFHKIGHKVAVLNYNGITEGTWAGHARSDSIKSGKVWGIRGIDWERVVILASGFTEKKTLEIGIDKEKVQPYGIRLLKNRFTNEDGSSRYKAGDILLGTEQASNDMIDFTDTKTGQTGKKPAAKIHKRFPAIVEINKLIKSKVIKLKDLEAFKSKKAIAA